MKPKLVKIVALAAKAINQNYLSYSDRERKVNKTSFIYIYV